VGCQGVPGVIQSRGYEQADLLEGFIIAGAEIKSGAATLSF
jgi:hypothetical protein